MNRRSTSCADSDAVGSSRMRTRASTRQRLGDLDQLLVGHRQAADRRLTSNRTSSSSNSAFAWRRIAPQSTVRSAARRRVADEHVLGDGQVREQPRLLVDDGDARAPGRGPGRASTIGSPSSSTVPVSGLVDAGQDLDERALARAVLADQRVDLAGAQLERDVGQRLGRARTAWRRRAARRPAAPPRSLGAAARSRGAPARSPSPCGAGRAAAASTGCTSMPRPASGVDHRRGRAGVGHDRVERRRRAERRERGALPLRVVDESDDLAGGRDHERLICASSSVASVRPGLEREPGRAQERALDVDLVEQPVAERADEAERLPADEARRASRR